MIAQQEDEMQAIAQDAVTGRIPVSTEKPYPAMKDSGVEWLGRVPEHWKVRQLSSNRQTRRLG